MCVSSRFTAVEHAPKKFGYEFKKDGTKAALKELGPRFTLRLKALQKGTFNPKFGQFEWILKRHEMETSRRSEIILCCIMNHFET
ncbi:Brix domain-containing protein F44G4.1 [Trichinella sp. T8]|nr:Brix domain-containing protein F44G4.1 [Trichinella sp. T8]